MSISGPQPFQMKPNREIVLLCTVGNYYFLYAMFTLVVLLSVLCFSFSYMGTDLPKNYNEGKAVTFCLLIFFISWTLFLTLFSVLEQKYISTIIQFSIFFSVFGVLLGYFGPKCYIIIFKPERNTATYFQAAIQTYTLQTR